MGAVKAALRYPLVLRARARDALALRHARYELAVAAIFREEAPFLDEWLRFHAGIGVGHFYLYDNFSTDGFRDVLGPWIARRLVTLHDWPVETGQLPAYRHCVRHHADEARWIAFIDIDEFLFSPRRIDIRPILAEFRTSPAVLVQSPYFGSSGHRKRPAGSLLEAYTRRAGLDLISGKTIANPRWIRAIRNVHRFKYLGSRTEEAPALDRLRLNHYWSRSMADLETKIRRGDAASEKPREAAWHLAFEAKLDAEEDRSIIPVARAVLGSGSSASQ